MLCEIEEYIISIIDTVLLGNIQEAYKQNIAFEGDPQAVGHYINGGFLGFSNFSGIIMTTGLAELP